jgi:hypothetical protein
MKHKKINKVLSAVIAALFLVDSIAYGLSPVVTSSELGAAMKSDTRQAMYTGGRKLLAVNRGPGAIGPLDNDVPPRSFIGQAPQITGVRPVKVDWDHPPEAWVKNPILKMTNIVDAFNYFKDHEAQIPYGKLFVKIGYFEVDEAAGELPIARIEVDSSNIATLVIHYKFAQIWEEIRKNDVWFEVDFKGDESGATVTRTVSAAWALFYRVAKHEMTDLAKYDASIKDFAVDNYRPVGMGHVSRAFSVSEQSRPQIAISADELAANTISGRYGIVNDGIWLWFLGSYCFTNGTRYSNPVLRERLKWFFKEKPGLVRMLIDRLAGRIDTYGGFSDEFPLLTHPMTRAFAFDVALFVNHGYFSCPVTSTTGLLRSENL